MLLLEMIKIIVGRFGATPFFEKPMISSRPGETRCDRWKVEPLLRSSNHGHHGRGTPLLPFPWFRSDEMLFKLKTYKLFLSHFGNL